jgi:hypothetical protein
MPTPDVTTTALTAGSKVGRAFSVISLIPSLFLVMLVWAVIASGAVTSRPNVEQLAVAFSDLSLGAVAIALLIAFAVGYVLHPIQFALTQFLEGYWGTSKIGQTLMVRGIKRNRLRQLILNKELRETNKALERIDYFTRTYPDEDPTDPAVPHFVAQQQLGKALGELPENSERVMATRLGNVLRRHEDLAGKAYGLPGVDVVPPLTLVADANHSAYMSESAEQLDAAVSVCAVTSVATLIVAATTLTDGWWLLTALVPYAVCLVAYRGAISVAHSYGIAMRRLVDLDRFALYEALRLPLPADATQEAATAGVVKNQLEGTHTFTKYVHPEAGETP